MTLKNIPPRDLMDRYVELARRHQLDHNDIHVIIVGGLTELLKQLCREQWEGNSRKMAVAAESLAAVVRIAPMREFSAAVFGSVLDILLQGDAIEPPGGGLRKAPPTPEVV